MALVMLYRNTDGANWSRVLWLWPPIQSPRYWSGIFVNDESDDRVRRVILPSNNMVGRIPSEIGNLGACRELNLEGNQIRGQIPVQISNMDSLEILSLGNNSLEFPLPNFSFNKKLITLDLAGNNIARDIHCGCRLVV